MKILLVDDHTLFRDTLVEYIKRAEPDAEVILAKDFYEGREQIRKHLPLDIVLLDLKMPGMNGLEGLKTLKAEYKGLTIALMSGVAEPQDVKDAIELGVNGYFPKTLSGKELIAAMQKVISGECYIPLEENDLEILPSYYADKTQAGHSRKTIGDIRLTPREKDVLAYLVKGAPNKEIALDLDLQLVTIKLHVRGICRKLNAKNRTQAAIKARELKLLS